MAGLLTLNYKSYRSKNPRSSDVFPRPHSELFSRPSEHTGPEFRATATPTPRVLELSRKPEVPSPLFACAKATWLVSDRGTFKLRSCDFRKLGHVGTVCLYARHSEHSGNSRTRPSSPKPKPKPQQSLKFLRVFGY